LAGRDKPTICSFQVSHPLPHYYWYPSVGLVNLDKAKQGSAKQKSEVAMMESGHLYIRISN